MSSRSRLVLALVSTALIGYIAIGSLLGRVLGDTSYGQLAIFNEVVRLVLDAYVEPVNIDRAMAGARQGMTDALDGDSAYVGAEDLRLLQQPPKEEAEAGLVVTRRFAFVMVVAARPASPAERAGLRPGDILKMIDDKHTRQMPAALAERLLRGSPGSSVKLGILRAGTDPFDVTIVRERVVPAAPLGRMVAGSIGYLKVSDFTETTGDELHTKLEVQKRSGASAVVLDLRDSAWGSPEEGAKVAEVFMQGGTVAKVVGRHTEERVLRADPSRSAWSGPLVVLVDNGTAGAGEVAAAALADSGRAKLVGERTFGRAGVSRTISLPEGGLILTVAKYVSPKGATIHGPEGIKPDVAVESRTEDDEDLPAGAERPDRILEKAIELLKGPAAAKTAA